MEKAPSQNIQDAFLNTARREKFSIIVHLLHGATLTGRIKSFDKFSVLLDVSGQDYLIFKHAISTISVERKRTNPEQPQQN
jgi:host factor-I protein